VNYVIDKCDEMKALLGHPFILRSVEKLMGADLIPTWDSMVLKLPGEGIVVPWHRDAGLEQVGDKPIFNVDFYMDAADEATCVWTIPGSHKWDDARVKEFTSRDGFSTEGAVPALMQPGDVMFHDILVVHGSPANSSDNLRRVIYYEFRTAHIEHAIGPHTPEYIPLKQEILYKCLEKRRTADYISPNEQPFVYNPPPPFNTVRPVTGELPTYRVPHEAHWRAP
jgi:ectoine hydroxylase-related dioxygenase (phytanoyl-CoA dioxygenase family)